MESTHTTGRLKQKTSLHSGWWIKRLSGFLPQLTSVEKRQACVLMWVYLYEPLLSFVKYDDKSK